ncbi:PadR family transcriptional regulator [Saccharopolyspora mangrovi]|uniref:PadR family transcriptional regulator n=1 Tax=Saccharopolyspora mangrovi TaxID=3082379 RepID=A0ABU6A8I4_9PSEU|nr:PadR family transcriptional regulator [Saccharopolyspora sp. S2-29]MEB3367840.1 PadR family transcriptional regulator [Saccharopolyspora sp. S2-29]
MSTVRLTNASYVVLGLIEVFQPATAYDLKRVAGQSVVNFWSLPHTQLYSETSRLAEAGLLNEEREESGRRRRSYTLSEEGQAELDRWRAEPVKSLFEVHDPATLKLFFGADPATLAADQIALHEEKLREYEETRANLAEGTPRGIALALEMGIGLERHFLDFWRAATEQQRT